MATHQSFPGVVLPCIACGSKSCSCGRGEASIETICQVDGLLLDVKVWVDRDAQVDIYVTAMTVSELASLLG